MASLTYTCTFFIKFVNGILRNWESLCDIRPDCHHHFDASGTSNAMFDELAERSLMSPLAGTKHTYVRLAIIVYCQILALFFMKVLITVNQVYQRRMGILIHLNILNKKNYQTTIKNRLIKDHGKSQMRIKRNTSWIL